MNDEIKEILDKLKETVDYPKLNYSSYDKSYNETIDNVAMIKSFACKQLLDYITNLQQENERLKNRNDFLNSVCVGFDDKYEDYKSRVEKAVEYIKEHPTNMWYSVEKPNEDFREVKIIKHQEDLLNILQNGSDDNV